MSREREGGREGEKFFSSAPCTCAVTRFDRLVRYLDTKPFFASRLARTNLRCREVRPVVTKAKESNYHSS